MLALTPAIGRAQERRVHFNLGGGATFLTGTAATHFSTGWGPEVGLTFQANDRVEFQFKYDYSRFNAKNYVDIFGGQYTANHQTHELAFNLVLNVTPAASKARVYVVVGPGAYYRKVQITEYVGTGVVCDPWFYICGTYPITSVVGSRGGWDPGFNIGGGVGFKMGEEAEFTIETRYVYVWGPDIQPPAGSGLTGGKANGTYIPLMFGFRF
jgi:opacity protein-like surface antigen